MTDTNDQNLNSEVFPENFPEIIVTPTSDREVEAMGSVALFDERRHVNIGEEFNIVVTELPANGPKMALVNGEIQLDQTAREAEIESVNNWLNQGVREGDEKVLEVYMRNLVSLDATEEEIAELAYKIQTAFRTQDISHLMQQLDVSILSAGIAERNLIREGLRPELLKQPLYFKDSNGKSLSGEENLDIVISRGDKGSDKFKVIVGSKQGIGTVHIAQSLSKDIFIPDLKKASKDPLRNVISIPLKKAADGTEPSIGVVEVHMGAVDLLAVLSEQERTQAAKKEKNKLQEQQDQSTYYSPPRPAPRPGRWTSSN